jgi:hypothetical protein
MLVDQFAFGAGWPQTYWWRCPFILWQSGR